MFPIPLLTHPHVSLCFTDTTSCFPLLYIHNCTYSKAMKHGRNNISRWSQKNSIMTYIRQTEIQVPVVESVGYTGIARQTSKGKAKSGSV